MPICIYYKKNPQVYCLLEKYPKWVPVELHAIFLKSLFEFKMPCQGGSTFRFGPQVSGKLGDLENPLFFDDES